MRTLVCKPILRHENMREIHVISLTNNFREVLMIFDDKT